MISMIAYRNVENDEQQCVRIKKNEMSNPKRAEFNRFIDRVDQCEAAKRGSSGLNEILENLKTKSQAVYSTEELSQAFEHLLKRAESDKRYELQNWSEIETTFLFSVVAYYCVVYSEDFKALGDKDWQFIEGILPTKQVWQITKKWSSILRVDVRQYPWTLEEDQKLMKLVNEFGAERNWRVIAEKLNATQGNGIQREMRQCKERWIKHLDPKVNKGDWSRKDDFKLMKAFVSNGNKWSEISKLLGNRTDVSVKNRFKSLIKMESKTSNLDCNLSQVDGDSERAIASRIVERISASFSKKDIKVGALDSKPLEPAKMKVPEANNSLQTFKLLAKNQSFDFRVQNPLFTGAQNGNAYDTNMFFAVVDMTNNRIRLLNQVSDSTLASF